MKPRQSRTRRSCAVSKARKDSRVPRVTPIRSRIYASSASQQKRTSDAVPESPKGSDRPKESPVTPSARPQETPQESKKVVQKEEKDSDPPKGETQFQKACRLWFKALKAKGLRNLREEWFNRLKKYRPPIQTLTTEAFTETENLTKNRYDDVPLLDKSRVKVRINPDKDDYIHASIVDIDKELKYVCAQGPLLNTVAQFWLMCIQEETKVILQLCQNVEDGKEKCVDYMPDSEANWTEFGAVKLKVVEPSAPLANTKDVFKTVVTCKHNDKEFTLVHLLYVGWADHSVPEDIQTCCEIRKFIHKQYDKKPIVAHCSAGIGRTGTFVAIEMVLSKLMVEFDSTFTMVDIILKLRDQRALAIQNDQQFAFIIRVALEIIIAEGGLTKSGAVDAFIDSYDRTMNRKKKKRQTARGAASRQPRKKATVEKTVDT